MQAIEEILMLLPQFQNNIAIIQKQLSQGQFAAMIATALDSGSKAKAENKELSDMPFLPVTKNAKSMNEAEKELISKMSAAWVAGYLLEERLQNDPTIGELIFNPNL